MKFMKHFVSAAFAGAAIALGSAVGLSIGGGVAAALLSGLGILIVMIFDLSLFTMKTSDLLRAHRDLEKRIGKLVLCMFGNIVGAAGAGLLFRFMAEDLTAASFSVEATVAGVFRFLLRAFFGGLLVYIATHGYNRASGGFAGCLIAILSVSAIEICGFSFALVDAFRAMVAWDISVKTAMLVALEFFGNFLGVLIPAWLLSLRRKTEKHS